MKQGLFIFCKMGLLVNEKIKILAKIIIGLILIQGIRIILKFIVFCFVEKTLFIDTIASALIMTVLALIGIMTVKKKGVSLSVFPNRHKIIYAIATVVALVLLISTPFITGEKSLFIVFSLIYSTLITPIFEELIFRGYVWNKLEEKFTRRLTVYIITTLLFAVWHIGYIDSIALRVASNNVPFTMLMKIITGLCFGIVLGAIRCKTKNCYSTILLHGAMNIFGR